MQVGRKVIPHESKSDLPLLKERQGAAAMFLEHLQDLINRWRTPVKLDDTQQNRVIKSIKFDIY